MITELTLGSLFDGIAGFPLAAERHGIKTLWASEIEPDCIDIAGRHFPEVLHLGDITKINGANIPCVDIISFGSPCQNMSVAGNGKGLEGDSSKLFFEAIRIIDEMRGATNGEYPKYIVWENVAGAFSSNKGQDFRRVLEEITKTVIPMPSSGKWATAGMVRGRGGSTAWRQLDAQYWGVPQRRKRIYLVHDFTGERAGQILFECESLLGYVEKGRGYEKGSAGQTKNSTNGTDNGRMVEDGKGQLTIEFERKKKHTKLDFGRTGDRIYMDAQQSVTLMGRAGGGGAKTGYYLLPVFTIIGNVIGRKAGSGGNQTGFGMNISPTLTVSDRHAIAREEETGGIRKYRVRSLTPTECERLDGFPDDWTKYGKNGTEKTSNARIMALGNSIAVPCAERVFIGILAAEDGGKQE